MTISNRKVVGLNASTFQRDRRRSHDGAGPRWVVLPRLNMLKSTLKAGTTRGTCTTHGT